MNRILLAVCGYQSVPFDFLSEFYRLRLDAVGFVASQGVYIEDNRSQVVNWALERPGWDYLLFIDPDMTFPFDLMERVGKYTDPVVGGTYWRRTRVEPVVGLLHGKEPLYDPLTPKQLVAMLKKPALYPVEVLGTGCLAIRRDVLEDWPPELRPVFQTIPAPNRSSIVGEDVYFCWQLKQLGIPAFLDTAVCCGHIGARIVDRDAYLTEVGEPRRKQAPVRRH